MSIHVICFSKDRPLQLHGYLSSLFANWADLRDVRVSVLVRATGDYGVAYQQAIREVGGPVIMCDESDFSKDVALLLKETDADYTCFGVDDAVFTRPVVPSQIARAFAGMPGLLGYSLRLGRNIRRNLWAGEVAQPIFKGDPLHLDQNDHTQAPLYGLCWDVSAPTSRADWAYPWEIIGTVYPTDYVKAVVAATQPTSPSQLEARGAQVWAAHTDARLMAASWQSCVALPVPNRVQAEFPNPVLADPPLSPEFLLDCWHHGLRMDTERFGQRANDAIHVPDFYLRRAT